MKKTRSLRRSLRYALLMAAVLYLLLPPHAWAASKVGNPAIIQQLEIVKDTLATLGGQMDELSTDLQTLETNLISEIGLAEDRLHAKIDFLVEDATAVKKDIKISSTLCFGANVISSIDAGVKLELGAGWPNIAWAKGVGVVNWKLLGLKGAIGEKICIKVPLYSVASAPLEQLNNTEDFDELIAGLAASKQAVLPVLASLYSAVMPSSDSMLQSTANIIEAATGYDIYTGVSGPANPANLFHPEIMFGPIMTETNQAFVAHVFSGDAHIAFHIIDPFHLLHWY